MPHRVVRGLEPLASQIDTLLLSQTRILESIASGAPLALILDQIARLIEADSDGLVCAIHLLDPDGCHLRFGAAPSLPSGYREAVDGAAVAVASGSYAAAIHRQTSALVTDTTRDPLWRDLHDLVERFDLRASWSHPIVSSRGDLLGILVVHARRTWKPTSRDEAIVHLGLQLARIALERVRAEDERRRLTQEQVARADAELARQHIAGFLDSTSDAFFALDDQGRFSYVNRQAKQLFAELRGELHADLVGKRVEEVLPDLIAGQFESQYREVIVGRKVVEFETYFAPRDRWYEVRAYPGQGEVAVYFRDITARMRAQNALRLLASAGSLLTASLDFATTLREVIHLSVPSFADYCIVFLVGDDQKVRAVEVGCADVSLVDAVHRALHYALDETRPELAPVLEAMRSARTMYRADLSPSWVESYARNDEHLQILRRMNLTSFVAVPLVSRGSVLGAIVFARSGTRAHYGGDEVVVAEEIARRCATALENARLYHEATTAREELQRQLDFTRAVTQSAGMAIYTLDQEGRTTFVNPAAERLLGWTQDELLGRLAQEMIQIQDDEGVARPLPDFLTACTGEQSESARAREGVLIRKDGTTVPVRYTSTPIVSNGRVLGTVLAFEDVSEWKKVDSERIQLTAAVERERSILAATMASMRDGLVVADRDGVVRYFNQCAAELLRVDSARVLGKRLDDILDGLCANIRESEKALASFRTACESIEQRPSFEVVVEGPPRRDVVVDLFPVVDTGGGRVGAAALLRDVTGAKLLASLQERERIAMDLHDGVIQSLYGISLGLGSHERVLDDDQVATRATIRQARAQIGGIIQMIRNYIFDLRLGDAGTRGLRAGLEALAEELHLNTLVPTTIAVEEEVEQYLTPPVVGQILQIAREATSNVIRHASARSAAIRATRKGTWLTLTIVDDGRGFASAPADRGHGLRNMAKRAREIGGRLTVRSTPGNGTTVRLVVPLDVANRTFTPTWRDESPK